MGVDADAMSVRRFNQKQRWETAHRHETDTVTESIIFSSTMRSAKSKFRGKVECCWWQSYLDPTMTTPFFDNTRENDGPADGQIPQRKKLHVRKSWPMHYSPNRTIVEGPSRSRETRIFQIHSISPTFLSHWIYFLALSTQLKPRSVRVGEDGAPRRQRQKSSSKDPFGAALPREQVLKQRGIDAAVMDSRIERKAEVHHFTKEQEEEIETVREQLVAAEKLWREANEKELPEESFRIDAEAKRKELNDLMDKFSKLNTISEKPHQHQQQHHHRERHSERRSRMEDDQRQPDNDAFHSFSSNNRRRRAGGSEAKW